MRVRTVTDLGQGCSMRGASGASFRSRTDRLVSLQAIRQASMMRCPATAPASEGLQELCTLKATGDARSGS